jgi:hypothetical protein
MHLGAIGASGHIQRTVSFQQEKLVSFKAFAVIAQTTTTSIDHLKF